MRRSCHLGGPVYLCGARTFRRSLSELAGEASTQLQLDVPELLLRPRCEITLRCNMYEHTARFWFTPLLPKVQAAQAESSARTLESAANDMSTAWLQHLAKTIEAEVITLRVKTEQVFPSDQRLDMTGRRTRAAPPRNSSRETWATVYAPCMERRRCEDPCGDLGDDVTTPTGQPGSSGDPLADVCGKRHHAQVRELVNTGSAQVREGQS